MPGRVSAASAIAGASVSMTIGASGSEASTGSNAAGAATTSVILPIPGYGSSCRVPSCPVHGRDHPRLRVPDVRRCGASASCSVPHSRPAGAYRARSSVVTVRVDNLFNLHGRVAYLRVARVRWRRALHPPYARVVVMEGDVLSAGCEGPVFPGGQMAVAQGSTHARRGARGTASLRASRRVFGRGSLDAPFVRNAYSLVGSTLATSGFGVLFWIVAAHLFTKEEVGRDTALISTMLFLSSISQLNLTNGFNRFVPVAGVRTRRLVVTGYLADDVDRMRRVERVRARHQSVGTAALAAPRPLDRTRCGSCSAPSCGRCSRSRTRC